MLPRLPEGAQAHGVKPVPTDGYRNFAVVLYRGSSGRIASRVAGVGHRADGNAARHRDGWSTLLTLPVFGRLSPKKNRATDA